MLKKLKESLKKAAAKAKADRENKGYFGVLQ